MIRLEEKKGDDEWDVKTLREQIRRFMTIRQSVEMGRKGKTNLPKQENIASYCTPKGEQQNRGTAEALVSHTPSIKKKCLYCLQDDHWSDECQTYPTLQAKKEKIKGKCFGCLNGGHQSKDCKRKVKCFHCKKEGHHHSSLCARKFGRRMNCRLL